MFGTETEMEAILQEMLQDPMYAQVFWMALWITLGIMLVFEVVAYFLQAFGVRRLCLSAGMKHPALAFVPIVRWTMFGRLAEMRLPRERVPRKAFPFSVHLPVLMTLQTLLQAVYVVHFVRGMMIPDAVPSEMLERVMNGVVIAFNVIHVITAILLLLALFRVFSLIGVSSPMILTFLCMLVTWCLPILLFAYRKNAVAPQPRGDKGNGGDDDGGFYYDNK